MLRGIYYRANDFVHENRRVIQTVKTAYVVGSMSYGAYVGWHDRSVHRDPTTAEKVQTAVGAALMMPVVWPKVTAQNGYTILRRGYRAAEQHFNRA